MKKLRLIPHDEPDYSQMKCRAEEETTPHDSWTFHRLAHECNTPTHQTNLFIVIRRCQHCGTFTEWMQITGEEGGVVEVTLTSAEVDQFLAGLA